MGDRAAERRVLRALDVDVDPLVVAGHVGERVDVLLGHLVPVGGAERLALGGLELFESGDRPHGAGTILPAVPAPLLLCDTPGLLYRGFFALPDSIKGAEGRPVNALVGSVNMTLWCIEKYKPRAVVMCFGQESAHYRVEAYPDYHAARPRCRTTWRGSGSARRRSTRRSAGPCSATTTLEADDLMGSFAALEAESGGKALILTADRDMFQCATDDVTILLQRARQQGPDEVGPGPGARDLRDRPRAGAGLHRAARRPLRRAARARRASAPRPPPTCSSARATSST